MIDTSASNIHRVEITSAQVNDIVEGLTLLALTRRIDGPTPELNELIDSFDTLINEDMRQND